MQLLELKFAFFFHNTFIVQYWKCNMKKLLVKHKKKSISKLSHYVKTKLHPFNKLS